MRARAQPCRRTRFRYRGSHRSGLPLRTSFGTTVLRPSSSNPRLTFSWPAGTTWSRDGSGTARSRESGLHEGQPHTPGRACCWEHSSRTGKIVVTIAEQKAESRRPRSSAQLASPTVRLVKAIRGWVASALTQSTGTLEPMWQDSITSVARICSGMGSKIDFLAMAKVLAQRPMVDNSGRVTRHGRRLSDRLIDLSMARLEKGGQVPAEVVPFRRKDKGRDRG